MGEARRRGTFEQRKKQSIERERQVREKIWDEEQRKRRASHPTSEMIANDGDVGRPVRPHRSGGGRRPRLLLAMAAALSIGSIK